MKKSILNLLALAVTIAFFTISCSKEEVQPQQQAYPTDITLDNWEAFVDAPNDILQAAMARHDEANSGKGGFNIPDDIDFSKNGCVNGYIGSVKAWNGSGWAGLENVIISSPGYYRLSSNTNTPGRYTGCRDTPESCMSYYTSSTNGVTVSDVIVIRRHILGIELFNDVSHPNFTTADNAARKYVAADVNFDGLITEDDIDLIIQVILAVTDFPENMVFVPTNELNLFTLSTTPAALSVIGFSSCRLNTNSATWFRYAIKRGDVNGNFTF